MGGSACAAPPAPTGTSSVSAALFRIQTRPRHRRPWPGDRARLPGSGPFLRSGETQLTRASQPCRRLRRGSVARRRDHRPVALKVRNVLAVLYDIHGNAVALDEVLKDAEAG